MFTGTVLSQLTELWRIVCITMLKTQFFYKSGKREIPHISKGGSDLCLALCGVKHVFHV